MTAGSDDDGRGWPNGLHAAVCIGLAVSPAAVVVGVMIGTAVGKNTALPWYPWGWVGVLLPLYVLVWLMAFVGHLRPTNRRARLLLRSAAGSVVLLTVGTPITAGYGVFPPVQLPPPASVHLNSIDPAAIYSKLLRAEVYGLHVAPQPSLWRAPGGRGPIKISFPTANPPPLTDTPCTINASAVGRVTAEVVRPGVVRLSDLDDGFVVVDWTALDPRVVESRNPLPIRRIRSAARMHHCERVVGNVALVSAPFVAWTFVACAVSTGCRGRCRGWGWTRPAVWAARFLTLGSGVGFVTLLAGEAVKHLESNHDADLMRRLTVALSFASLLYLFGLMAMSAALFGLGTRPELQAAWFGRIGEED